jgi:hypothetical protein
MEIDSDELLCILIDLESVYFTLEFVPGACVDLERRKLEVNIRRLRRLLGARHQQIPGIGPEVECS